MTQEEYLIFTGEQTNYTLDVWERLVNVAKIRLASFLCTSADALPKTLTDDFKMLLANFISATLSHQGSVGEVQRKAVRNFTIEFKSNSAVDAFAQIAKQYPDIIELYSNCGSGFAVERTRIDCCGRKY